MVGGNITQLLLSNPNVTDNHVGILHEQNNTNVELISIGNQHKPALVREYKNETSPSASLLSAKCINIFGCPSHGKSFSALGSVNRLIAL